MFKFIHLIKSSLSPLFGAVRLLSTNAKGDQTPTEVVEVARKTRRDFFREVAAKDNSTIVNRHVLAKQYKDSQEPITLGMLNSLLEPGREAIPEEVFQYMDSLSLDSVSIACPLPISLVDRQRLYQVIGSTEPDSTVRATGIYLFRDANTGELLYMGSSKHLGARGPQYLVPSRQHNIKGLWGNFVRSNPTLSGVTIGFITLPAHMAEYYVSLEQLFLLKYTSLFNMLLLATPGGGHFIMTEEERVAQIKVQGHKTHMYLADRSARVHSFLSTRDAAKQLGSINHNSIAKGMANDRPVKGFYFSKEVLPNVPDKIVSIDELRVSVTSAVVVTGRPPKGGR